MTNTMDRELSLGKMEQKRVGEFRKGKLFNITEFGKNGKILKKWVHGIMVVDKKKEKLLFLHNENG